ncbi:MAG: phage envelope protein [Ferruginibacter sp.]|nr:phage envelope protein [Ferruginibacter sp.]
MVLAEQIQDAYKHSTSYPDLVFKLISLGVQSYTVDVATGIILYRFDGGVHELHQQTHIARQVAEEFNHELTVKAVKDNQQGKTDYPGFMNDIARAGVRFYEATFTGNLRVTYIGIGGLYEEEIPV